MIPTVTHPGAIRHGEQTRFNRGLTAFLAAVLLLVSIGAESVDFHHALHEDESQSQDHSCILALLNSGNLDLSPDLDCTVHRFGAFEFLEVSLEDIAPSYVRPRLLPWALGPPLIG